MQACNRWKEAGQALAIKIETVSNWRRKREGHFDCHNKVLPIWKDLKETPNGGQPGKLQLKGFQTKKTGGIETVIGKVL